jgi:hypothetical protein
MTYMGKILVWLNLAAAVLVGVMLAIHAGTEPNWKAANDTTQQELTASRTNTAAQQAEIKELASDNARLVQEVARLRHENKAQQEKYEDHIATVENTVWEQVDEAKQAQALAKAAEAQASRLGTEVAEHQKTIKRLETTILTMGDKMRAYLARAVGAENNVTTLQVRLKALLNQLENMSKRLVKLETGGGTTAAARDPNAKNPPAHLVRGIITGILRDRGLVEVSIGSDDGVNEGHTLEVYRLEPRPEYLGTIKILNADHHKAVGQIMRSDGVRHNPIAKGDEVASRIMTGMR